MYFHEEVMNINDQVLGEGSFGIVKFGFLKTLGVHCAVKKQKTSSRIHLML